MHDVVSFIQTNRCIVERQPTSIRHYTTIRSPTEIYASPSSNRTGESLLPLSLHDSQGTVYRVELDWLLSPNASKQDAMSTPKQNSKGRYRLSLVGQRTPIILVARVL